MSKHYQIAIDGPGGSGKTTVAKTIAKKLNLLFVNTGGMYRCYAIALLNTDLNNLEEVQKVLNSNNVTLSDKSLYLNGVDVTEQANSPIISALASKIGTIGIVREKCVRDQQEIAKGQDVIMEGRDTTTVVLPNATLKVFLTATVEERAKRRWLQYQKNGDINQIKEELVKRDFQDSNRKIAPLTLAKDAFKVDSENKTLDEIVEEILILFEEQKKVKNA